MDILNELSIAFPGYNFSLEETESKSNILKVDGKRLGVSFTKFEDHSYEMLAYQSAEDLFLDMIIDEVGKALGKISGETV